MNFSSIELWQRLAAEGLASPMQCRSWAGEVAKLLSAAETADGLKVLQKLIDIGKVTKYQAKILAGQSSDTLRRGPWHVLSKIKHPLWLGWLEITKIDTSKGEQPPPRWARWLDKAELDRLHPSAPSLPRGIQLANIQAPHLQTVEMPELINGELQLRVHPVAGASLAELFATQLPSPDQALQIVQQTATALAVMHEKQVVHGRVTPDRIFWDDAVGVTLVRDPISVWTAGVDADMTGVLGEQLVNLQVASFLAPEFLAPKQPPGMRSDIYALGATWWWLLTGRPPADGKSVAEILGRAAEVTLDFKHQAVHLPDPIRTCLEYCLAKNPSARIANAGQLCAALAAAERSVAKGKIMPAVPVAAKEVAAESKPVVASSANIPPTPRTNRPINTQVKAEASTASAKASNVVPSEEATIQPIMAAMVESSKDNSTQVKSANQKSAVSTASSTASSTAKPTKESVRPTAETKVSSDSGAALNQPAAQAKSSPSHEAEPQPPKTGEVVEPKLKNKPEAAPVPVARKTSRSQSAPSPIAKESVVAAEVVPELSKSGDKSKIEIVDQPDPPQIGAQIGGVPETETAVVQVATNSQVSVSEPAERVTTTQSTAARTKPVARKRTQRKSKLPLFITAGFGFIAVVLGVLKFSGALDSKASNETAKVEPYKPPVITTEPTVIKDPLLERFRIVEAKDAIWAPPAIPEPVGLDLLPPGAQLYIVLRPNDLLSSSSTNQLLGTLDKQFQLGQLLNQISSRTGQQLESIASVVIAFYNAPAPEQVPISAVRVELRQAQTLDNLKSDWKAASEVVVGQEKLLVTQNDQAFFVPKSTPSEKVSIFSTGPVSVMSEAAELAGGTAPLNAQFKQLHSKSSRQSELIFLGSPRYLFTEGRGLAKQLPNRLQALLEPVLSKDARGALLQLKFGDRSYWELQLVGATDAETPRLTSKLDERASAAAAEVERWFVDQTPHPYWRALAFRFPQMIRTWREYTRFGVEDGVAIANGYLPAEAASNLIVASWIAFQEASTMAGQLADTGKSPAKPSVPGMTPEEILNRSIRLSFDQEPIERALALVGEEANSGVPAESQLRFELDGGAFERAGITRNQQLRDFKSENQPARNALTEIAKRGNPVTTVTDTREADQRLIWVIKDDPLNAGRKMVSLTTRDTAAAAGNVLPVEFAPQ